MLQLEERINNLILGVKGFIKMVIMYCFCVLIGEFALFFLVILLFYFAAGKNQLILHIIHHRES